MSQVSIRINGRSYDVTCENGQESHVQRLAMSLAGKVSELVRQVGQVGDARLLVMAGLLVADELVDAEQREHALLKQTAELQRQLAEKDAQLQAAQRARLVDSIGDAIDRWFSRDMKVASRAEAGR